MDGQSFVESFVKPFQCWEREEGALQTRELIVAMLKGPQPYTRCDDGNGVWGPMFQRVIQVPSLSQSDNQDGKKSSSQHAVHAGKRRAQTATIPVSTTTTPAPHAVNAPRESKEVHREKDNDGDDDGVRERSSVSKRPRLISTQPLTAAQMSQMRIYPLEFLHFMKTQPQCKGPIPDHTLQASPLLQTILVGAPDVVIPLRQGPSLQRRRRKRKPRNNNNNK